MIFEPKLDSSNIVLKYLQKIAIKTYPQGLIGLS